MKFSTYLFLSLFLFFSFQSQATDPDSLDIISDEMIQELMMTQMLQYMDSVEQTLEYKEGTITLPGNIAIIEVPKGFKYLNGDDSEKVLTELWGNPPSAEEDYSLGMLIPADKSPLSDSMYAIDITFVEDGYIDDGDAADIDYDDLLGIMQEDADASNEQRIEMGYETIQLIGWAAKPYYDSENKKLHWAKEFQFGDAEENTLNYNIRILGRRGFLQLNAIGEMFILDQVKEEIPTILGSVNFNEGHKYSDFDPEYDKVAAYGVGALIAGKVLAKAGILAKIGIFFAKFWKFLAIGAIALATGAKRLFSGRRNENDEEV